MVSAGVDQQREQDQAVRLTAWVRGRVQRVGMRWWIRARALELGLAGWARNLPDGRVDGVVERWSAARGTVPEFEER